MANINASIKLNMLLPALESVGDAVFIDDNSGICIWCNAACEDMYVESREKFYGKTVDELVSLGIFTQSVTKEVLAKGTEMAIIHENKNGRHLLTSGHPIINDAGDIEFVITISRDITRLTNKDRRIDAINNRLLDVTQIDAIDVPDTRIISTSIAMKNVLTLVKRLARVESPVLIKGESGVGKGLIARALHDEIRRAARPFVHVNCSAIPDTLMEAELFGYVRGTFTGTRAEGKVGLIETANGGTLFLDEISELPFNIQVKILRLIQDHTITRVGSINNITLDVRIVSASNKNLYGMVQEGKFRDDLYYSLNVAPITVPPLRERAEDILPLVQKLLRQYNRELDENKVISSDALTVLLQYTWPGNVRELQNIIERLNLTTPDDIIDVENLPSSLREDAEIHTNINTDLSLQASMEKAEKEVLKNALATYKSTRAMARVLKVSQPTIVRKLNKYGLTSDR